MPIYTKEMPTTTLPNNIRSGNPNPNVDPVLGDDSIFVELERSLGVPLNLTDGKSENYKRPYYSDVFSAQTTSGYTNMKQVTFVRTTGVVTGYQYGVPIV